MAPPPASGRPAVRLALLVSLSALLGPTCGQFNSIGYFGPGEAQILVTSAPVYVFGRMGKSFDPATAAFEIDGVDLVTALGLTPPFQDEGGVVVVGPDAVTVSGFSFAPPGNKPAPFAVFLAGLSPGAHTFTTSAEKAGNPLAVDRNFSLVNGFSHELATLATAGLVGGPRPIGSNVLANQSLGQGIAAPPIAMPGGASLRSGHVEAVEGRIGDGGL